MMIFIMLLGIALAAAGVLLVVKVKSDMTGKTRTRGKNTEQSEEIGTTLASMGSIMCLASIVKMAGAITTAPFVFIMILDVAFLSGLLYLINKKHTA